MVGTLSAGVRTPWLGIFDLSPGFVPNKFRCLSRVVPQKECDAPVAYGAMVGPGDLTDDAI